MSHNPPIGSILALWRPTIQERLGQDISPRFAQGAAAKNTSTSLSGGRKASSNTSGSNRVGSAEHGKRANVGNKKQSLEVGTGAIGKRWDAYGGTLENIIILL